VAHQQRETRELLLELVQADVVTGTVRGGGGAALGGAPPLGASLNAPLRDRLACLLMVGDVRAGLRPEGDPEMLRVLDTWAHVGDRVIRVFGERSRIVLIRLVWSKCSWQTWGVTRGPMSSAGTRTP